MRLDLDVRRLWQCDVCRTERRTSGRVTAVNCHFCQDHPPMKLVEPQRHDRWPVPPPDLYIDLHPDDVDAPAFVPVHLREQEELRADAVEEIATTTVVVEVTTAATADATPHGSDETPSSTAEPAAGGDTPPQETAAPPESEAEPRKKPRRKKKRRRKS